MTPEDIAPTLQVAVLQEELATVEGPEELDTVLPISALLTTQSMFSSHGIFSTANCSTLFSTIDPPVNLAVRSNSSITRFWRF